MRKIDGGCASSFLYRKCSDKSSMESPISLTEQTTSISGTPKPQLIVLEATQKPQTPSPSQTTISPNSLIGFKSGEANKPPVHESQLPTAEEILAETPPNPRVMKMKSEEFFQWRQVLGSYLKQVREAIQTIEK